jgi:hypothetical protein
MTETPGNVETAPARDLGYTDYARMTDKLPVEGEADADPEFDGSQYVHEVKILDHVAGLQNGAPVSVAGRLFFDGERVVPKILVEKGMDGGYVLDGWKVEGGVAEGTRLTINVFADDLTVDHETKKVTLCGHSLLTPPDQPFLEPGFLDGLDRFDKIEISMYAATVHIGFREAE